MNCMKSEVVRIALKGPGDLPKKWFFYFRKEDKGNQRTDNRNWTIEKRGGLDAAARFEITRGVGTIAS